MYVMLRGMVLGEAIGNNFGTFAPVYRELALGGAVFDPAELHVHGLGGSLIYSVVGDSGCALVVSLKRSGSLGMVHLFEHDTKGCGILGIKK